MCVCVFVCVCVRVCECTHVTTYTYRNTWHTNHHCITTRLKVSNNYYWDEVEIFCVWYWNKRANDVVTVYNNEPETGSQMPSMWVSTSDPKLYGVCSVSFMAAILVMANSRIPLNYILLGPILDGLAGCVPHARHTQTWLDACAHTHTHTQNLFARC